MHVAVLDDDPTIRRALERLLRTRDMTVDSFATAGRLFDSLPRKIPDCLLLDFQMPEMSGLEVLNHLGQEYSRIPTIIITGYDGNGVREACINAGAAAYLLKPLDADQLIETIADICRNPPSPALPRA